MKTLNLQDEEGQSLIQVALMLVVLIGFVGLAIDGGNLYAQRRRMQNAADAAALAGAWQMCKNPSLAQSKGFEFLQLNGATSSVLADVVVDNANYRVKATAKEAVTPFLPFTFGGSVTVGANATAACGAANSACGLWPVGFNKDIWDYLKANGGCGKTFAVWGSNKEDANDKNAPTCEIAGVPQDNLCGCYDCAAEGISALFATGGRAWLNYPTTPVYTDSCAGGNCGVPPLACQIRGNSGAMVTLPQCVTGDKGLQASLKNDVDFRQNDNVSVALYDPSVVKCPAKNCGSDSGYTGPTYWLVEFGCIKVVGWDQNFSVQPLTEKYKKISGKVIKAIMNCNGECDTTCGSTDGSPPDPNGINVPGIVQ